MSSDTLPNEAEKILNQLKNVTHHYLQQFRGIAELEPIQRKASERIEELMAEKEELAECHTRQLATIKKLENGKKELTDLIGKQQAMITKKQSSILGLEHKLTRKEEQISNHSKMIDALEIQCGEKQQTIQQQAKQINKLNNQLAAEALEAQNLLNEFKVDSDRECNSLRRQLAECQGRCAGLEDHLDDARDRIEELARHNESLVAHSNRREDEREKLKKENARLRKKQPKSIMSRMMNPSPPPVPPPPPPPPGYKPSAPERMWKQMMEHNSAIEAKDAVINALENERDRLKAKIRELEALKGESSAAERMLKAMKEAGL